MELNIAESGKYSFMVLNIAESGKYTHLWS